MFDGRNYSADIKLSEIENGNVATDPDQVYFMFSKPSAKIETGRIPDARVDIARKAYFKYSGIHLINDIE